MDSTDKSKWNDAMECVRKAVEDLYIAAEAGSSDESWAHELGVMIDDRLYPNRIRESLNPDPKGE